MAHPEDILSAFEVFDLPLLPPEWVNEIWQEGFSSCPEDLPDDFAEKYSLINHTEMLEIMKDCQAIINEWLGIDEEASWTSLQQVEYKSLMALLYFYVKKAPDHQNVASIELGIEASQMYFTLLSIPGSNIYHIFHVALFEACLEVFSVCKLLLPFSGAASNRRNHSNDNLDGLEDVQLTIPQQKMTAKNLNKLLMTLKNLGGTFSFKSQSEALRLTLSMLAELTRLERFSSVDMFVRCADTSSLTLLAKNAYLTMKDLCIDLHGRVAETVRLVLFRIMPNLTLIGGSNAPEIAKMAGKEQTVVRNLAVWFVKNHVIPLGEDAHTPLKILVEHMCRNMTDRADYRGKATDMVVAIVSEFPEEIYYVMLKWILCEAMTEGANHRVVAMELLSKLIYVKQGAVEMSNIANGTDIAERSQSVAERTNLYDPSTVLGEQSSNFVGTSAAVEGSPSPVSVASDNSARIATKCQALSYIPLEFRRGILAILADKIQDVAPSVRAKGMMILSEIVGNRVSPTVQKLVAEILVIPYQRLDEIDMETKGKDFVKWATLVDCIDQMKTNPGVTKSMVPSGVVIVNHVLRKLLEDRVTVRRAALSLLVNIFKLNAKWMTKENLALFGRHCRDRAMSIRKEMIGWVTDLMLFYPSHHELTQLWVQEVVPQVSDREIRVQEHLLQILTTTILSNIKPLDKTRSSMDELPWRLLMHIAQQSMRSFLVAACLLWRNNRTPELSQNRIAAIMTHIGSDRDVPAWVLLSSISEYIDIENPQPIMDHYFDNVTMEFGERGTANLVLTTLKNCWHKLERGRQLELMGRFHRDVRNGVVPPYIISQVVDMLTAMMVTLDIDEEQGKKEVAMWVTERTQSCEEHLEECLKNQEDKIGECKQCLHYLSLLGCLADIHPGQINRQSFDALYNFVMSRHSGVDLGVSNLKAAGVITLGRMALRDSYIASGLVSGLSILMSRSRDAVLLNNAVVCVADIGERFPNLIEPLVSALSLCLKSKHRSVKEITLVLLIELLQEDYLKARGALLYHLMTLTVDPCKRTVCIVKFYFTNCLLVKQQQCLDQILLTSMFHFNQNYDHPQYPRLEMTEAEEAAFDFSGPTKKGLRLNMYRFLLRDASSILRIRCAHFVCNVVLNSFADEILSLEQVCGQQLLGDALTLLLSKELMFDFDTGKKKADEGEEDEEGTGTAGVAAKGLQREVLAEVQKRTVVDTIIPICCKLRKRLTKHQKIRRLLYRFVREAVRDFKNEIADIFRDDKQFGHEILHEINHTARGQADEDEDDEDMQVDRVVDAGANHLAVEAEVRASLSRSKKRKSDEHVVSEPIRIEADATNDAAGNRSKMRKSDEIACAGDVEMAEVGGVISYPSTGSSRVHEKGSPSRSTDVAPARMNVMVDVHANPRRVTTRSSTTSTDEAPVRMDVVADIHARPKRAPSTTSSDDGPVLVNVVADVHSRLSCSEMSEVDSPDDEERAKLFFSKEGSQLNRFLNDMGVIQEKPVEVPSGGQDCLLKELRVVLTDIEELNRMRARRSQTGSADSSRKDSSDSDKSTKSTKSQAKKAPEVKKSDLSRRSTRSQISADNQCMPPPSSVRNQRKSARTLMSTPTAASKNKLPSLMSSTPLVASSDEFESDISPVLHTKRRDDTS